MKRVVLIMQALLSVLIVNAQNFRDTDAYLAKISVIDSLLLDTKLKNRDRCEYLKESIAYKDTIIFVLRDSIMDLNSKVKGYEEQLEKNRNELKIKDFILCSDTTVFGSKFVELEIDKYPNHIREYYQLIYDLRNIDQKLFSIEEIVSEVNTNELTADLNPKRKCAILQDKTNEQILDLREQLLKLKERDMSYLSEEQIRFFNEYLKPKYNNLIDVIYNDLINQ